MSRAAVVPNFCETDVWRLPSPVTPLYLQLPTRPACSQMPLHSSHGGLEQEVVKRVLWVDGCGVV